MTGKISELDFGRFPAGAILPCCAMELGKMPRATDEAV